jgi:hypothetical protein
MGKNPHSAYALSPYRIPFFIDAPRKGKTLAKKDPAASATRSLKIDEVALLQLSQKPFA